MAYVCTILLLLVTYTLLEHIFSHTKLMNIVL